MHWLEKCVVVTPSTVLRCLYIFFELGHYNWIVSIVGLSEGVTFPHSSSRSVEKKTQPGARQAVLLRPYMNAPRTSVDPGLRAGFPVPLFRPQWIHLLGEIPCKAHSLEDRTRSCLCVPSNSIETPTNLHTKCHWGQSRQGWVGGGKERIQPSVFLLHLMFLD